MIEKLVLDAAPLLGQTRQELLAKSTNLYTTPAVFGEIRDEDARLRLETLKDNLKVQQPSKEAVAFVTEFAKKTGDFDVLSAPDIGIIALAYDLYPDQTKLQKSPQVLEGKMEIVENLHEKKPQNVEKEPEDAMGADGFTVVKSKPKRSNRRTWQAPPRPEPESEIKEASQPAKSEPVKSEPLESSETQEHGMEENQDLEGDEDDEEEEDDDDWITPENVTEKVKTDNADEIPLLSEDDLPVVLGTNDFAVQNVSLQIGLEVMGSTGMRIKKLKTFMQRCHACFKVLPMAKDAPREFCPRCGGHTLRRVTVTVQDGKLHLHLKSNFQWRTRGDRYSVPKPQSIRARRQRHDDKVEFYAEDQPEYQKALKTRNWEQRRNQRVVDAWIGPGTVEGSDSPFVDDRRQVSKVKVGRGRNANAVKK